MRVLGIDPGTRFTGFGVVEQCSGKLVHIGHGVIRADEKAALELRLASIFKGLESAMALYRPDAVAVEGLFSFKNARSALILGHARGVALLVAAQSALPVFEYPPAKVKRSVGAGGAAAKDAVERMVKVFLRLTEIERADASDALAVAICHLNHAKSPMPVAPTGTGWSRLAERMEPSYRRYGGSR